MVTTTVRSIAAHSSVITSSRHKSGNLQSSIIHSGIFLVHYPGIASDFIHVTHSLFSV